MSKVIHGMELTTSSMPDCDPCGKSKSKQHYSRVQQTSPLNALGHVHIDLIGPLTNQGVEGEKYISVKTAGKSQRQWVATSDSKAMLGLEVITWCRQMKAQGATITEIFCDNAKELIQARNWEYFNSEGIRLITSPPYNVSRNGIAEQANGITEDQIRASMITSSLPMRIWLYCARYMAWLHNLISNSTLPGKNTPMESWNQDMGYANPIPNVAKVQAFGHPSYVFIPPAKRVRGNKFAPRAQRGHLVGMKGEGVYEMWILETDKVIPTASVKFDKYGEQSETTLPPPTDNTEQGLEAEDALCGHAPITPIVREMRQASSQATLPPMVEEVAEDNAYDGDAFQLPKASVGHDFDGLQPKAGGGHDFNRRQPDDLPPTRSNNRAPCRQEISADINKAQIIEGKRTRQNAGARAYFTSTTFDHCLVLAPIKPTMGLKLSSLPPEPRNYQKFMNHPQRPQLQAAMNDEFNALMEIDTFRPATAKEIANNEILPAQWVWAFKGDTDGFHMKDKARMVVCGN
jgi:hypothetical protein